MTILSIHGDVVFLYNKASLVFNPSYRHKLIETFGLMVLETMSRGLLVIVLRLLKTNLK
ncbi:MAG: glycosyltransferase [Bacteroidales bacterium]|nr:glycosyltransferase [Bacteroidales bacterium]